MTFRTRAPLAAAAASLLALAGCSDSTGSSLAGEGSVTFTYAGAESGAYDATGRFNRLQPDQGTFAVGGYGELESGGNALAVLAHARRGEDLADELLLTVASPELGEITCGEEDADTCPFAAVFFVGADAGGDTEAIYTSVTGTLSITSINEDRARGEFTFRMEGFDLSEEPVEVQVTSGIFDVPIVPGVV